jgi:hypothetical protein
MIKTASAIVVAAIVTACLVGFPSTHSSTPGAKGDRADVRRPYFDAAYMRDARAPLAQPRDVWIISADAARQ